jgi:hypothetical protein
MTNHRRLALLAAGLLAVFATPALAVDGVIEINQARASKGGVTPGDAPGFPITISTGTFSSDPMSFRLTGPLFSSTSGNVIEVTSPHVTIDLNGFSISCLLPSCNGIAISSAQDNIEVRNGTVRGFTAGLSLLGAGTHVEGVRATGNDIGIQAGNACSISDNVVNLNTANGILVGNACQVRGNTATNNGNDGICTGTNGHVYGNIATGNAHLGLNLSTNTAYSQNSVSGNLAGTVMFGVPAGLNVCNGSTTCP